MIRRTATGAALASVLTLAVAGAAVAATLNSYPAYLGGPAHDSYVPSATTVTVANAGGIHSLWSWTPPGGDLASSPIVNAGIIYIGAENGNFYAINATTGKIKWTKKLTISNCANSGIISSATVLKDSVTGTLTVYIGAGDHYLYALKAATGATVWRHLIGPATSDNNYYNFSSPTIANGHVYYTAQANTIIIVMTGSSHSGHAMYLDAGIENYI